MLLGSSRWTYPLLSVAVCLAALLAPHLLGHALDPLVLAAAAAAAAVAGWLVGNREDTLRALAAIDALTGLGNRRHFDRELTREIAKAKREHQSVGVLVIDLDELKALNDLLGHAAGDRALCAVADALRHGCGPHDIACRWGGDEFVIIAPRTDDEQARALADRIAATVHLRSAGRPPVIELGQQVTVPELSVCIGVAAADETHPALLRAEALFAAADRALYEAKSSGKGRVFCAGAQSAVVRPLRKPVFAGLHRVAADESRSSSESRP
jgi:diguanylate cyclase (GGDEF)-like protein